MYMASAKTMYLCVVMVLFSSSVTKSEEIFGGMGCEIINLKMLSMVDGEIKYSENYGDMAVGKTAFITYSYTVDTTYGPIFSFVFTEDWQAESHDTLITFKPNFPTDSEEFYFEKDMWSGDLGVKVTGTTSDLLLQRDAIELGNSSMKLQSNQVNEAFWQAIVTKFEPYQSTIIMLHCNHSTDYLNSLIENMKQHVAQK